ncbi:MAG: heavy-metal-associated domain-containing protein [Balneolaceae bacterium]|nr:MAG: heavy-metal-associated domain-containing protein [Balneolaceae bacterium]
MNKKAKKIRLLINGMHCSGCTNSVEKALRDVTGVTDANVQLTTEAAEIHYEGNEPPMDQIREAVKKAGFDIEENREESVTLEIGGMHCTGCSSAVEKAIQRGNGILNASVNLPAGKAFVEFDSSLTNIDEITGRIEDSGYEVLHQKKKPVTG